jgi:hypothetical protein
MGSPERVRRGMPHLHKGLYRPTHKDLGWTRRRRRGPEDKYLLIGIVVGLIAGALLGSLGHFGAIIGGAFGGTIVGAIAGDVIGKSRNSRNPPPEDPA